MTERGNTKISSQTPSVQETNNTTEFDKPSKLEYGSWMMYDAANSSFTTLIVTVAFGAYFTQLVAPDPGVGDALWGRATALSMLFVAIISPVLGAASDVSASKRIYMAGFTALCIAFTAMLYFVDPKEVYFGLGLFIVANVGFAAANTFYNAFLREISTKENVGRISGYGWAVGYIGGLVCLVLCFPLIKGGFIKENIPNLKLSFLVVAGFFLVLCIPTFLFLKERARRVKIERNYISEGFYRVGATIKHIRSFSELSKFMLAFFVYNDGITTIIAFSSIYAISTLNFTGAEIIQFFIITNVTAAVGAFAFGFVQDKIGGRKTIIITLLIWIFVVVWAYLCQSKLEFVIIGSLAGTAMGSCQSASRGMVSNFSPKERAAEFFGFQSLAGKCSSIIGPLLFGEISRITGSQRLAILSVGAFFLVGLILLLTVDEQKGIEQART